MPLTGAAKHCDDGGPPGQSSAVVWPVWRSQTVWSDASWQTLLLPLVPPLVELEPPPQFAAQNCCSQLAKSLTAAWPPGCAVMQPLVQA